MISFYQETKMKPILLPNLAYSTIKNVSCWISSQHVWEEQLDVIFKDTLDLEVIENTFPRSTDNLPGSAEHFRLEKTNFKQPLKCGKKK